jgi:hypothetical protein
LDIEDRLKLYGLFYDRKKGEYRRLRKPIAQIIGPDALAQAVIAIALQKPDEARARPSTYVSNNYDQIFDDNYDKDLYAACILMDRQVAAYMEEEALTRDEKRDLRFYIGTILCSLLANKSHPTSQEISGMAKTCVVPISTPLLETAADMAITVYKKQGATDKAAKSVAMRTEIISMLEKKLGV